ncbi:MAG: hypothetical protein KBA82_09385 [Nitrosomonas sp.]|nr:hypothetical protein [Nitrosomonas sp.]MBP7113165.1 hypothetical protein [Nitrosomonas sp.]
MNTRLRKYLMAVPMLSLLISCAQMGSVDTQVAENRKIAINAKTHSEHNKLASYYDSLAEEMSTKAEEKKGSLADYDDHSQYYGRQGQDFKSHTLANIRYYEQAAEDSVQQASFHRKIAAELLQRERTMANNSSDRQDIKANLNSGANDLTESPVTTQ